MDYINVVFTHTGYIFCVEGEGRGCLVGVVGVGGELELYYCFKPIPLIHHPHPRRNIHEGRGSYERKINTSNNIITNNKR